MYIDDKFLLNNDTGRKLYEDFAKDLPIYDYHCHLDPKEIAEDKQYENLTQLWLAGDHYKWRAMRINGVEEKYITGDADDYDKFLAWAKTMPELIGNPLYQWSHLELQRYFGIDKLLNEDSAKEIWEEANQKLKDISTKKLITSSKVTHICTTDDPLSNLEYHKIILEQKDFDVKVFPTFRPDKGFSIEKADFCKWFNSLETISGKKLTNIDEFVNALANRIDYFSKCGCKLADHGFSDFNFVIPNKDKANETLQKKLNNENLTFAEIINFRSYILVKLAEVYIKLNWTVQMHIGALRNTNTAMFKKLGPDSGFDCMGDFDMASQLCAYFDYLDNLDILPKTIIYNLNAKDNDVFSSMMGNYPKENVPLRVAYGAAWWFYDQKNGIENQIRSFANFSVLGRFLGMVTDSRSFLSYTRHDYFRRVFCNLLGQWVDSGDVPRDYDILEKLIKKVCYDNALNYFGL